MTRYDAQLVIGQHEVEHLGESQIMKRLERYILHVQTKRLIIWNSQGEAWFDRIIDFCERNNLEAYLWYPVLADCLHQQRPSNEQLVCSATAQRGYGRLGCWDGFSGNDENFLFRCPEHAAELESTTDSLQDMLNNHGFKGVFLDRIRYPSPANGLDMLFSCFCDTCMAHGQSECQSTAEKALQTMSSFCLDGHLMSWDEFVSESSLKPLMERRFKAINQLVGSIYESLDHGRFSVGLDLFSPCLAQLVGQSYSELADRCDWIKAMTYTKAIGPAGLPLEATSMIKGLLAVDSRIKEEQAAIWIASLLDLPTDSVEFLLNRGVFNETVLLREIQKATALVDAKVPLVAGIELVDHPVFPTRIEEYQAESMIRVAKEMKADVIACWNLLYIPESNYRHLQAYEGEVHG